MKNEDYKKAIAKWVEYAKTQGCPKEIADKIPAMIKAMIFHTAFKGYDGPTPEEINPGFFE